MSVPIIFSRASYGVQAPLVSIETHLSGGLPAFNLVGLPETAVRESKDRVRSAIQNAGFEFPMRRITVNLAPADLPKHGTRFDLPIALGILAASHQIPNDALSQYEFVAELALTGRLRKVSSTIPTALAARSDSRTLVVASDDAREAAVVEHLDLYGADDLDAVCAHISGASSLTKPQGVAPVVAWSETPDIGEVNGQFQAKRALEIAAAGGHHLLFVGAPGTGKTMLANRLRGLLPPLNDDEAFESAAIQSVSESGFDARCWRVRPFRSPHHTSSAVALIGGGGNPKPGEVSLAHHGILFLDELPEFERRVLEVLREPLETGNVTISRAARSAEFPARFQLVAAMNPCPCGFFGDGTTRCECLPDRIARYRQKISGPLLDRLDLHVEVARQFDWLNTNDAPIPETSADVAKRVAAARATQYLRQGKLNYALGPNELNIHAGLDVGSHRFMRDAYTRLHLSPRAYHRIVKVARTIADLDARTTIELTHLQQAISLRCFDRKIQTDR